MAADPTPNAELRALLLECYGLAVARAHPSECLTQHLPSQAPKGRIIVIGAGKANGAMTAATEKAFEERGLLAQTVGLTTTRHGFSLPTRHIELTEAAHPVPDAASSMAAKTALTLARMATPDDLLLVLLSGGASALWSAPAQGLILADKQAITRALLRSGATISEINTVRRHLSRIKGGRLAQASKAEVLTLAISDVPGDVPQAIGSGPTVADPTTLADAEAVLAKYRMDPPPQIARALADPANETMKPGSPETFRDRFEIVAAPKASIGAAALRLAAAGYKVVALGDALEGEAREVGREHAALAIAHRARRERVAIISGGEFTVTVTGSGSGGPNQEYALGLAVALDGLPGISALSADTDGIDGGVGKADDPAGAFVFPDTLQRARAIGRDAAQMLGNNDSTAFFRALGDLIEVGPTQTNVNDLRIVLVDP